MSVLSWTCPYCNKIASTASTDEGETYLTTDNTDGIRVLKSRFTICPNPECKKFVLTTSLYQVVRQYGNLASYGQPIQEWNLIPPSKAKPMPSYIPKGIVSDYKEACIIANLSPKASATLSRRCLQGMIRDFWKVTDKPNLKQEIEAIKDQVDPLTWDAIEAVRGVGNIGAHMESDINLIVDVDPEEATMLIGLIESLISDWYVVRENRKQRLEAVKELGKKKKEEKNGTSTKPSTPKA